MIFPQEYPKEDYNTHTVLLEDKKEKEIDCSQCTKLKQNCFKLETNNNNLSKKSNSYRHIYLVRHSKGKDRRQIGTMEFRVLTRPAHFRSSTFLDLVSKNLACSQKTDQAFLSTACLNI